MHVVLDRPGAPPPPASGTAGPTSTSKPMSAKAVAITLAPRSWPSWPILTTSRRGRRPSSSAKAAHVGLDAAEAVVAGIGARRRRREMLRIVARWRVKTFSSASEISPTVARARAASIAERQQIALAARRRCVSAASAAAATRRRRGRADPLQPRHLLLAHPRVVDVEQLDASAVRRPVLVDADDDLLAAVDARPGGAPPLSSIRSFGMPGSTALVMPPSASTSSISVPRPSPPGSPSRPRRSSCRPADRRPG